MTLTTIAYPSRCMPVAAMKPCPCGYYGDAKHDCTCAPLQVSKVPQYADTQIDTEHGVLLCSTADEDALYPLTKMFGRGVYHSFDYPFYYFNIQANAENRVARFQGK